MSVRPILACPTGKDLADRYKGILHVDGKDTPYGRHALHCPRCQGYQGLAYAQEREMERAVAVVMTRDHDYQISGEGYLPPLDMPPARLPNGKELERIYWREDVCRKCGHAVRVV